MVHGSLKSGRFRKVKVKGSKIRYKERNRKTAKCAVTKKRLSGIPRLTNSKFKKLPKSKKTVARPYGSFLSHTALKEKILNDIVLKK